MLWTDYCKTKDVQQFSDTMLKFPSSCARPVFQKILGDMTRISIKDFVNLIKNNPLFFEDKKGKSFTIACTFYYLFYTNESCKECVYELFTAALKIADRNREFSAACLKSFNQTIIADDRCKRYFFNVKWDQSDKTRIYKFIKNLEQKHYIDLTVSDMKKWIDENQFEKPDRFIVIEEALNKCIESIKDENTFQLVTQIKNNIIELKNETCEQAKKINNLNHSLDNKEKENTQLRRSLSGKKSECNMLQRKVKINAEKIDLQEKRIYDLESELGMFSQTAVAAKTDEIDTLKKDIYLALKNEYEKYMATKESACTEDLFTAYKSRFFRIFAILKRFGIVFEEEA